MGVVSGVSMGGGDASLKGIVKGWVDFPVRVSVLGVYLQEPVNRGVVVRLKAWGSVPLALLLLVGEVVVFPGVQVGGVGGGGGEGMEELFVGFMTYHGTELGGGV